MKFGSKVIAVVLLFVGLILVNYLAASWPGRIDTTGESIYTLSSGTKNLLSKLDEPVHLDFYFSRSVEGVPISYKNYAARVQEMLRQYARASHGKVILTVTDPKPDTPEEEKATTAGLTPQRLPTGENIEFGLVATQADLQKNIPAFTPQREQFLEYDVSQLIYSVQQFKKKKLGLLTSLPLRAAPQSPMMMMRQQPQQENQYVIDQWEQNFDIVPVEATATELPADLDALAVVHPENVGPKLQFAIDQFLLGGKPVFIAVDPSSQYFKQQGGQMAMFGGPQPNVSSDLPELFRAYGITYNPQNVVGDLQNATDVGNGATYPTYLSLGKDDFSLKALPTAQLNSLLFVETGSLSVKAEPGVTVTDLITSSAQSGDLPAAALGMTSPDQLGSQIKPSGKRTLAVLIQGKLKSAFPQGAPKDEKPATGTPEKPEAPKPAVSVPALAESKSNSTLIVVADTDWLLDNYSIRRINFLGNAAAEPINDNLSLASNTLEFLSGSQDLISIRGKGSSMRPFTVVHNMQVEAQKKYQQQLTALESRLNEVQTKLSDLQSKKGDGNRLIATPEVTKTIEDFRKQESAMQSDRRKIRRALTEDIDSLGHRLLAINLLIVPLGVCCYGFWFYNHRRK